MSRPDRIGPLFTDLYELTMAAGYHAHHHTAEATFSTFIRKGGDKRAFFVAAGIETVLSELADMRFTANELDYLNHTGLFPDDFLGYLETFRFTGDIHAMTEGDIFFQEEPILEVTAPMIEAQIVETFVLNTIGFQTMIATKAARCITAADGRPLVDFSLRRTQGRDGGMSVARSTYLAGFDATSNVLAGKQYGIPISGTMAHSFITAFGSEPEAFSAYARIFPDNSVFLIDTYDTETGAHHAARVATEMKNKGARLKGVRLDSGDMADLSIRVRKILDDAGHPEVKIFASSGFDEYKITEVLSRGARIDAFGVGTKMGVSADSPYCDIVYKLVRYANRDIRKLSPGKVTLAGKKQVFRRTDAAGRFSEDIIGVRDETIDGASPMLERIMAEGRILRPHPDLHSLRERCRKNLGRLLTPYKALTPGAPYPVTLSPRLRALQDTV